MLARQATSRACRASGPALNRASLRLYAHNSNSNGTHYSNSPVPWLCSLARWRASTGPSLQHVADLPTDLDAIIMLAGGLTESGGNPPWVQRRLDTAHGLWQRQRQPCPILCLGGGTPHKPPILDPAGYVIHESTACATYLLQQHSVPAKHILKETSSYDTVGNAWFALATHALPAGWRNVAVITSDFHMPRSQALFQGMWARAASDLLQRPDWYSLWFAAASDEGLFEPDVLEARRAKEAAAVVAWQQTAAGLPALADVHAWMHATHQCYAVSRQHEFHSRTIKDPRLLASY